MDINAQAVAVDTIQNLGSLVDFSTHKWTAEKIHSAVTREVKTTHGASGNAGKYKVNLANGFEHELRTLTRPISRAYHAYVRMTISWNADRMLSNTRLIEYLTVMAGYDNDLNVAKADLLPKLPALIQRAIAANNGLCSAADYPTAQDLLDRFNFTFDEFSPIADAGCFGALPEGFEERFSDSYNERVGERMEVGLKDLCKRIRQPVTEYAVTLRKDKPKFFQGTLDNIGQMTETLCMTNLANDPAISSLCDALRGVVQYSAEQLKLNMTSREETALYCDAVGTAVDAILGNTHVPRERAATASALSPAMQAVADLPTPPGESDDPLGDLLGAADSSPAVSPEDTLVNEPAPELAETLQQMAADASPAEAPAPSSLDELITDAAPEPVVEEEDDEMGSLGSFTANKPKDLISQVADMDESELIGGIVDESGAPVPADEPAPADDDLLSAFGAFD